MLSVWPVSKASACFKAATGHLEAKEHKLFLKKPGLEMMLGKVSAGVLERRTGGGRPRRDGDSEEEWSRDTEVDVRTEGQVYWKTWSQKKLKAYVTILNATNPASTVFMSVSSWAPPMFELPVLWRVGR